MNSIFWLIILALLILIEIITLGVTTIWFAGGALAAFIVSLFFDNLVLEVILFLAISITLFLFTRPMVVKYFNSKSEKSDEEGVIGKMGVVIAAVDNMNTTGMVAVDGQEWSARSLEGNILEIGARVTVKGISGAKLIVTKSQSA